MTDTINTKDAPVGDETASDFLVVFVTTPTQAQAEQIAELLVSQRLAACVTMVPNVTSVYRWQGEVCRDQECLLVVKTRATLFEQLAATVSQVHSYQVPEILALPVRGGAPRYAAWLWDATRRDEDRR